MKHPATDDTPAPVLPPWMFDARAPGSVDEAAFASGAALALLHGALHDPGLSVPDGVLRARLALRAAGQCCKIEGRGVAGAALRDAYYLTMPGDAMGPDGDMLAFWRAGAALHLRRAGWQGRLRALLAAELQAPLPGWIAHAEAAGSPVARAAALLGSILGAFPRAEAAALLCADVMLARSLGWGAPLPLLAAHVSRRTLRAASDGADIGLECHIAVARAAQDAIRAAHDLARRAARLRAVAPRLRSKGAAAAIGVFLSEDAVLPSAMLSPIIRGTDIAMTDRSARRLCDRLVALGVVRELTGRATFRLYGLG
ncbi:DUF1403 family protein [Roseovarius dicentrarchi]|uniref:DUF1403 family protein n=1 Tax=Roseovarius dicentrarchi TaxID=2250573 RepID=UPI000DEBAC9C|nr:DUF1403 family protein [Roseovarius dicentrarchi]